MWVIDGFVLRWSQVEEADVGIGICAEEIYIPYRLGNRNGWLIILRKVTAGILEGGVVRYEFLFRKDFEVKFCNLVIFKLIHSLKFLYN